MNSGSLLFQELSEEELASCSLHYLGEPLLDWRLLTDGLFNTTYRLDTAKGSYVLRLGPVNRHLLMDYEHNLMEAEVVVQRLLKAHGIPTSDTVVLDTSRTFLDRDVAIVRFISGFNMASVRLQKDRINSICREVGSFVRRIHNITADELDFSTEKPFGRCSMVLAGQGSATWSEAVLAELRLWSLSARENSLFDPDVLDRIEKLYRRYIPLLDEITCPRLIHGDLWYANILLDDNNHVAGIIDGDRAFFGDPQIDLNCSYMEKKPFLEGYGTVSGDMRRNLLRGRLYTFLLMLEDCHVLKMEYNKPEDFKELHWVVLNELDKLEMIEPEGF